MAPEQISNVLMGLILGVSALGGLLTTNQRKAKKRARRQSRDLEEATEYIVNSRRERHVHNDEQHPDGIGAIAVPKMPPYMTRGDDTDE